MKVFLIGGGGREHTLAWKIKQSPRVEQVFCAPGNAGIEQIAQCVRISSDDIDELARFAKKEQIDLTVVGPALPLTLGIVDTLWDKGLRVFGPGKDAAMLEGSKAFTKELMKQQGFPSAFFSTFTDAEEAIRYIE